jgi:hypothetical protein
VGLLVDARGAIEDVRREVRVQGAATAKLAALEQRLAAYEGSIMSAGEGLGGWAGPGRNLAGLAMRQRFL